MFQKTESYSVREFVSGDWKTKGAYKRPLALLPLVVAPLVAVNNAMAYDGATAPVAANHVVFDRVVGAFDPLVGLAQSIAYPIALVVVIGGALCITIGQKEKGFGMMQGAGIGYALVQVTPFIFKILADSMRGI